jgi:hypothetical protein
VLSLSSLLGLPVIFVDCLFPLLAPFGLLFYPIRDKWLFDFKVWIDGRKVLCCGSLLSAMLVVPVENFNSLS